MPESRPLRDLLDRWSAEGLLAGPVLEAGSPDATPAADLVLEGIRDDSRAVEPNELFVAVRGLKVDGHDFVAPAVARGAAAVAVERRIDGLAVPQVLVDRGAAALASAAAWWHGDPSRELLVVGITGTNGKTTTSFLARTVLEAGGLRTGLVGTIGIEIGGELRPNTVPNTTPGALELQGLLREMVDAGMAAAVIETSSHGLAADRVASVDYDAGIFTNLSHEHLDFHGTFEAYRDAKLRLFTRLGARATGDRPGLAIVNVDDEHGPRFADAARATGAGVLTYGTSDGADLRIKDVGADASRTWFDLEVAGRPAIPVSVPIPGRYNAPNAAAALGLAIGWDLDVRAAAEALERFEGVPGRMESVRRGQPFHVVIDFAHTPTSIDFVGRELANLARPTGGSLITVLGASGERDVAKRPLMGEAAAWHSRLVIVTEDDSRNEDPRSIFEQVAAGAKHAGKRLGEDLLVIGDRREAIAEAFRQARPGDVVLLAGKGHETWNMGPDGPVPWSDRETALELLDAAGDPLSR
ncbi:MAG TPA: UDP-N-acetylmuramoyl-L-alanyl-D-glutamate--2,6-diaminopimelate ligase [Candidatus Binatia bacterium]|nr:UDP-N-acetylmuramoyl-L-alanyl-D-glutamate--2,6-diaminopimelate ligase [Candidatus Binatia bacterium]